jgi:hypothetical protein
MTAELDGEYEKGQHLGPQISSMKRKRECVIEQRILVANSLSDTASGRHEMPCTAWRAFSLNGNRWSFAGRRNLEDRWTDGSGHAFLFFLRAVFR